MEEGRKGLKEKWKVAKRVSKLVNLGKTYARIKTKLKRREIIRGGRERKG